MELTLDNESLVVYKALASEVRLQILQALAVSPATVSDLALQLHLSKSIVSRHIHDLEEAQLIHQDTENPVEDSRKKPYVLAIDRIQITFPKKIYLPFQCKMVEVKLGYFSDFQALPSCGLASAERVIGALDDPRSFVLNERIEASLLWFTEGYVEYVIPNFLEPNQTPEMLDISLELSSEFPESNNNWPSDITFTINDVKVGTWTSPGNFSDVRGRLTPEWWDSRYSQYGILKHLRINNKDTGIDGVKISGATLSDLDLKASPFIKLKIGIDPEAEHKGGLTIFGENFGNYPQNIVISLYYSEEN